MKKRILALLLTLTLAASLSACGGGQEALPADTEGPETQTTAEAPPSPAEDAPEEKETYDDIAALYAEVVPGSEIKVTLRTGNTLHAKIMTSLASDAAPDGWADTIAALDEALSAADEKKEAYSASTASAELYSADEIILATGFNGAVQFNKFEEKAAGEGNVNPPTISKFEYDQISVGMTLSKVREIVGGDGTLVNSVGTAGVTSTVHTYRFPGEKEGSYADILFDDYVVYSKFKVFLE